MSMRKTFASLSAGGPDRQPGINPLTLAAGAALWIAGPANWPLWQALLALPETASPRGLLFVAGFGVMIAASMVALLAFFAWRPVIKPAVALLLVIAALGAYFMGSYHVVIDTTMMINVMQTDPREVRDLLSLDLVGGLLLLAGLPLLVVWRVRVAGSSAGRQIGRNLLGLIVALLAIAALAFAFFAELSGTMRNHRSMRYLINPANSLVALIDLAQQSQAKPSGPPLAIGLDARIEPRPAGTLPPLLVLVIGETGRADHFALNGYPRPTTPELAAFAAAEVTSFHRVMSCGTNTAASLPCMFSSLGKTAFEARDRDHENLLDLVQRAGMAVLWVDNQAGCKGLCERVPNAYARDPVAGGQALPAALCDGDECLDEALLHDLDGRLAALPAAARERGVLVVLHQMGSHGPAYFKRSPPDRKPFQPECTTNVLQQCEHAALVNAYDNSIAYTDHMLADTVRWLQTQASAYDTTMLYVSDHGESLGENNLYLHGLPYALAPIEQKHVPMVLWMAPRSASEGGIAPACVQAERDAALSHDNLFHTTLGVLGIQASEYKPALDMLAACRRH
jgi:lipid A ethanolaminephosphotransferase